jgi:hypothetical protein
MTSLPFNKLAKWGGVSFLAGVAMLTSLAAIAILPSLRGPHLISFVSYFLVASGAYLVSVLRLKRDRLPISLIWGFALIFRLTLLFTAPALSDDVFRYIWDGHLLNQGINPYALPVNSPLLDIFDIPSRALVNHSWMASPYLPTDQMLFSFIYRIAPGSVLAFKIVAVALDLLTGWLVMDILRRLNLPRQRVLIYLWSPLVIVEFAHSGHIDAWMISLVIATFWLLVKAKPDSPNERNLKTGSVMTLAGATLTKVVPVILLPILLRRWGLRRLILYGGITLIVAAFFTIGAGWGLTGPLDGEGLFGAIRIYAQYWNHNGGIYHWLEVTLTGYQTAGAVPVEPQYAGHILLTKLITAGLAGLAVLLAGLWAWRVDNPQQADHDTRSLALLRLATIPIGAYLLFTPTVHPWYVILIIPFLPFLLPRGSERPVAGRFLWPWLYFTLIVAVSYLSYIDPANPREFALIRQVEYLPFFGLLTWAALMGLWQTINHKKNHALL